MTGRPPARGVLPTVGAICLLVSFLAASQQQIPHKYGNPRSVDILDLEDIRKPQHFDNKHNHFRDTAVISNDASAVATLALAGSGHAVRAPPARTSTSPAVLSPQLQARSLQDWEVEDFVLLATVDGTIHARDRKTGAARWALEVPSSPMVETIYHQNQSQLEEPDPEDDFLWIVEPSKDGNLYLYHQGPNPGLQKLDATVKTLFDKTPLASLPGERPAVVYTADKTTTLYDVDARTGAILKEYSSKRAPINEEQSCRPVNEFENPEEEECGSNGILSLGRVEYTVSVQSKLSGRQICTLKFSEWSANTRDEDLHVQYDRTMDQRHIYSMHDGVVFGFDHSQVDGRRYTQKFSSPVVRVFDVARPINVETRDMPLVMLPQPVDPPDLDYSSHGVDGRETQVFVNCTETGGWYAMSETTYPLVTGRARTAQCYKDDFVGTFEQPTTFTLAQQKTALVGVHSISQHETGRKTPASISGPTADPANGTPMKADKDRSEATALPALRNSVIVQKGRDNFFDILIVLIFSVVLSFAYLNWPTLGTLAKRKLDIRNIIPSVKHSASAPPTPVVSQGPWPRESELDPQKGVPVSPDVNLSVEGVTSKLSASGHGEADGPRVRIQEPPQDAEDEDEEEHGDAPQPEKKKARRGRRGGQAHKRSKKSSGNTENDQNPTVDRIVDDVKNINTPAQTLEPDVVSIRRNPSFGSPSASNDIDGTIQIGQLKVYKDSVLGHGSHGTVVYRGSFDGREVAVKRMLIDFYDIASHEVSLLQESDDHANVIRYFCREQAEQFLYIALELCPASLQDVIEKPNNHMSLVGSGGSNMDVPNMLAQITAGVRYLHSLKIVHRDLKPQNILVAAQKRRALNHSSSDLSVTGGTLAHLRLLISDFGLCKKLEGDQSSFRATTAHAAGTSGWRAPELLVDDDTPPTASDQALNGETSEPAVVDPQTNRRATRAIDIFSLGCVFYYVLTRGNHPFDTNGKFMREANIVKGHHNLDDLQRLGDYAFEADDLIRQMLAHNPRDRPDATTVLTHPFFWPASDRLQFLCDVSDHFEHEPRDPPSPNLQLLESIAPNVLGSSDADFLRALPRDFINTLGKQRKYSGNKMLDLLRALRNKKNHYADMEERVKLITGCLPDGYLGFWTVRFPSLLINCHVVIVQCGLTMEDRFRRYFMPPL